MGDTIDWLALGVTFHSTRWANPALRQARDHLIVGTSNGEPKWPLGYAHMSEKRLAPDYVNMNKPYAEFRKAYRAKLHKYGSALPDLFIGLAKEARANGKSAVVLLCYEDVRETTLVKGQPHGDWCHRTLLAEFMQEQFGLHISEMFDPSPKPSEKHEKKAKKAKPDAPAAVAAEPQEKPEKPAKRLSKREQREVERLARLALPDEERKKVWEGRSELKSDASGQVFLQESLFG